MMESLLQALQPLLAPAFSLWDSPVTWAEIVAFVLSLAMVACNIRVNPIAWPLAIAASLLYCLLFWQHRLYGEAGLQIFFVLIPSSGLRLLRPIRLILRHRLCEKILHTMRLKLILMICI